MFLKKISEKEKNEIWQLVRDANYEFIPPLSQRESTKQKELGKKNNIENVQPHKYFNELMSQQFIVAKDNDIIIGFLSYIPDFSLPIGTAEKVNYVSTVIVSPKHRGKHITEKMYYELINASELPIATRTWSTNYAHLNILEKLNFQLVGRIPNDRGREIDTVYYYKKKEVKSIV